MEVNNKVFLHELDCSMESKQEIKRGQWALYDQIVNKGNIVVLSYFEVIDSCSFYALYNSNEKNKKAILSLFKSGRIKLNGFADRRTPAQCVVEQMTKYKDEKEFPYLFSVINNKKLSMPVEYTHKGSDNNEKTIYKNILEPLIRAIIYSDPQLMDCLKIMKVDKDKNPIEVDVDNDYSEFFEFLKKYVQMVLDISSIKDVVDFDGKLKLIKVSEVYDKFKEYVNNNQIMFNDTYSWNDILNKMETLKSHIKNNEYNNREQWYIQIGNALEDETDDKNLVYLSKAVIDSIYNISVESSVRNVKKDYIDEGKESSKELFKEIEKHTKVYWNDYLNGNHNFNDFEKDLDIKKIEKDYLFDLDWEYAAFLFENHSFMPKEGKNWYSTKVIHSLLALLKSLLLILLYYAISWLSDLLIKLPLKLLQFFANVIQKALLPIVSIAISEPIAKFLDKANMTGADDLKYSIPDCFKKIKYVYYSLSKKDDNLMEYSKG